MARIYRYAVQVVDYLGERTEELEIGYQLLVNIYSIVQRLDRSQKIPKKDFEDFGLPNVLDRAWTCLNVFLSFP